MPALPSDTETLQSATATGPQRGLHRRTLGYLRDRPYLVLLAAIVVIAVVLRLVWIGYANPNPTDGRTDDTLFYYHAAESLAAGKGFTSLIGAQTAQWPPGYPLVLAVIFKLFGQNIFLPKLLNVIAAGGACLLIYALGAKLFDRRAGLLGALLFAVFPGQIYFSTLFMTEGFFPAVLCLLIFLFIVWVIEAENPSLLRRLILGVLFGAAILTRSEAGVLLVVALIVWKLVTPSWRRFAVRSGPFVIAAVAAVAPWTIRNAVVMHAFVPVVSGIGHTLLAGHQSDPYNPYHVFPEIPIQQKYADVPLPEREIMIEREATRQSIKFIVTHPGDELIFPFEKFYHLYRDDGEGAKWVQGAFFDRDTAPLTISLSVQQRLLRIADSYYVVLMLLAGGGLLLAFSLKDKRRLLLVLVVAGWTAAHLAFLPTSRYHAPLTPIFALWAAVFVVAAYDFAASRLGRRAPTAPPRGPGT
jgi:4-amino-4-deoxy-L-arabinose transferase-like glycosyltransferase